ncbi:MAG: hypothetical protein P4L35_00940 [Ignavibacteriaceae bacterium]|nr:hypothetical protein [Ignavibacteriaceae bacterium]
MATIKKQVLGEIQGGIAYIKIKYRNGKPYVASKPGYFNMGKDPATLFKKSQGRFIGKLSKEIYKIEILKKIWSLQDAVKGYTYQHIWGRNYKSIRNDDLSGIVTLTPEISFLLNDPAIKISKEHTVKITAAPIGEKSGISLSKEKKILAVGIIILKNRIGFNESEISYLTINSDPIDLDITKPIDITLNIIPITGTSLDLFAIKKTYITLITLDDSGSPIHSSEVITTG